MAYGFGNGAGLGTGNDFITTNYLSNPTSKTVFAWMKPTQTPNYQNNPFLCKNTGNSSEVYSLVWDSAKWIIAIDCPSGTNGQEFSDWFTIPAGINVSNGVFVCIVWNSSTTWINQQHPKVFANGQECTQKLARTVPAINTLPPSTDTSSGWHIGRQKHPFGINYGIGLIGEVAIWDTLLTDAQAIDLTQNGRAPNTITNGLKIYYPLVGDAVEWVSQTAGTITGAIARSASHPTVTQAVNPVRPTPPAPPDQTKLLSLFLTGNSMTDEIMSDISTGLPNLVTSNSDRVPVFGSHRIPGSPFDDAANLLWNAAAQGFTVADYGNTKNALTNFDWKFVSIQPFDRQLTSDLLKIGQAITTVYGRSGNANSEILIYGRTPRRLTTGTWIASAYKSRWERAYSESGTDQPEETRAYFETLVTSLRTNFAGKKINLVPVGEVFYSLNEQAVAGTLPNTTSAWDFYDKLDGSGNFDNIHLNNYGSYIVALTYYSMLTKKTPIGVGMTNAFLINNSPMDSALVIKIQQTVKDVIIAKSALTGISTFDPIPTPSPSPSPSPTPTPSPSPSPSPTPTPSPSPSPASIITPTTFFRLSLSQPIEREVSDRLQPKTIYIEGETIQEDIDVFLNDAEISLTGYQVTGTLISGLKEVVGKLDCQFVQNDPNKVRVTAQYQETKDYGSLLSKKYGAIRESANYYINLTLQITIDSLVLVRKILPVPIYIKRVNSLDFYGFDDLVVNTGNSLMMVGGGSNQSQGQSTEDEKSVLYIGWYSKELNETFEMTIGKNPNSLTEPAVKLQKVLP